MVAARGENAKKLMTTAFQPFEGGIFFALEIDANNSTPSKSIKNVVQSKLTQKKGSQNT
jgi:hypothetical protein